MPLNRQQIFFFTFLRKVSDLKEFPGLLVRFVYTLTQIHQIFYDHMIIC
jgi:hypothetical protein